MHILWQILHRDSGYSLLWEQDLTKDYHRIWSAISALKALAEGLGIQTARVLDVDADTVQDWLSQAAEHMEAISRYLIHELHLNQVQVDEL